MSDPQSPGYANANTPFQVTSLSFNGGMTVETNDADIVVLVGPNNTGKSRTLQEMETWLCAGASGEINPDGLVALADLTLNKLMSENELESWFRNWRYIYREPGRGREIFSTFNVRHTFDMDYMLAWRQVTNRHLGIFAPHLVRQPHLAP